MNYVQNKHGSWLDLCKLEISFGYLVSGNVKSKISTFLSKFNMCSCTRRILDLGHECRFRQRFLEQWTVTLYPGVRLRTRGVDLTFDSSFSHRKWRKMKEPYGVWWVGSQSVHNSRDSLPLCLLYRPYVKCPQVF